MKKKEETSIFNSLFTESTLGIIVADKTGKIVMVNPETGLLFGYEIGELEGQKIEILIPDAIRKSHRAYRDHYHRQPERRLMGEGRDLLARRKDGSEFPVEISLTSLLVDEEELAVAFVHDVTKRLENAKALKESESRMSAIITTALDGIVTISEEGTVLSINPTGARLFGYIQEEIVGNNVRMLMPEPDKSSHDQYLQNYKETGVRKIIETGQEVIGIKKDGTRFPFLLGVNEVKMDDHSIYTGVLHDLTEQKLAEKKLRTAAEALEETNRELQVAQFQLEQMNEELEQKVKERTAALIESEQKLKASLANEIELNELKSRFVSMASHEFRTPLSSVLSSASLIRMYLEKGTPEKQLKHIERIKSSVHNLTSILNDFLSLEKLESGHVAPSFSTLAFIPFMKEVIDELQPMLKGSQEVDFHHTGDDTVRIDAHLVKNILFNLLSNGIKYSPVEKNIEVKSELSNQTLQVSVRDFGIGIPESDQKHMFSRFFRATNVTNIQGTGLGLTIVKRYLDLMGGTVGFTSKEGEGAIFYFEIPQGE